MYKHKKIRRPGVAAESACRMTTVLALLLLSFTALAPAAAKNLGQWQVMKPSIGVSAMHMQLLHNDRVVIFDRTDFGTSNLSLPNNICRDDPDERVITHDCTAHSAEYDALSNTFRPLMILTDTWCSSGSAMPNGDLVQTGGFSDGERAVRTFHPCDTCDWREDRLALSARRWYATNCLLPDGRQIVVGGRREYNYEFVPKASKGDDLFLLRFLRKTKDVEENNLYPFVHLNVDGHLFVYANNQAILLDYAKNVVVRTFPAMPGGEPRNYPSSGSSVLLPLDPSGREAEVLICGGAPKGSFVRAKNGKTLVRALDTCGRIKITDPNAVWTMETMPTPRVMGDMLLLPNGGEVLIINGAQRGTAGWEYAEDPAVSPVIYRINHPPGSRFEVQKSTTIPRLYHSTAVLLRDGRVLVGGSNPHIGYSFYRMRYPTDLSLEAFSPHYLGKEHSRDRPTIDASATTVRLLYGRSFTVRFSMPEGKLQNDAVSVTMVRPSFTTHSYSMNQRLLILEVRSVGEVEGGYEAQPVAPSSAVMAPAGYYMLFVSNGGIPSVGVWVHIH